MNAIEDFKYAMTAHYTHKIRKKFHMRTMVRCLALVFFIANYGYQPPNSKNARQSKLEGMTICFVP